MSKQNSRISYEQLVSIKDLSHLSPMGAIDHLGDLVDGAAEIANEEGLKQAIELHQQITARKLSSEESCLLGYYVSNAWAELSNISRRRSPHVGWEWRQLEIENQILNLRSARRESHFSKLQSVRQCQVLTNLGNALNTLGRPIDAVYCWNDALDIQPRFGMARANRGLGLIHYGGALYDEGHQLLFVQQAHDDLEEGLSEPLYAHAQFPFKKAYEWTSGKLDKIARIPKSKLKKWDSIKTKDDLRYRKWCLHRRLFLNPLNDLWAFPAAAHDCLMTPNIVVKIGEGPGFQGFFSHLKQEFVSSRYLLYEGIHASKVHFSDKDVELFDTLDYPLYCLATEKVKLAYRASYGLFDKIAMFLNSYLQLELNDRDINFRTLWYIDRSQKKGLRSEFTARPNWALRGLYWLSRDFSEGRDNFPCMEPEALEMANIRNHLEHRYLKLHREDWSIESSQLCPMFVDQYAYSIRWEDFKQKAIRLIQLARSAIIYLGLAIHAEEIERSKSRTEKVGSIELFMMKDEWKRHF